ncbi:hypothetical protein HHI36_011480, partial [Cryptolaemus montrouzieri]
NSFVMKEKCLKNSGKPISETNVARIFVCMERDGAIIDISSPKELNHGLGKLKWTGYQEKVESRDKLKIIDENQDVEGNEDMAIIHEL